MRIITGTLKGRVIPLPQSLSIRPTSDRAKESIFAIIDTRKHFDGSRVLDLFAGTGNLGFEALSRGASHVSFVEKSKTAVAGITSTGEKFRVSHQIEVLCTSAERYLQKPAQPFDLIFADPPYDYPDFLSLPDLVFQNGWLHPDGWLILEHDKRNTFSGCQRCLFSKRYGQTLFSVFS